MTNLAPSIRVAVDPTNPGQFFACCGLLELADRLWPGAEGWFENDGRQFLISSAGTLAELLSSAQQVQFESDSTEEDDESEEDEESDDSEDEKANVNVTPIVFVSPVQLRLDWWNDKSLKPWAGSMNAEKIALAMCRAIDPMSESPLNQTQVVTEVLRQEMGIGKASSKRNKPKPKEPFHFDARRGANALGLDVGFVPDTLKKAWKVPMHAHPVVEFLCLIGLQRCRPTPTKRPRQFVYFTWITPCLPSLLPAAVNGLLGDPSARSFRFENAFRTGQRKHKAFNPAVPVNTGDHP
ncbi:MAG: type I-U CRISPR-associated protein Cas8c [Planctomycetaceae bacterium]|nr:type I-U CRISPR-associated protein Cas8c [Planctomycetaceae bacterium]